MAAVPELQGERVRLTAHADTDVPAHLAGEDEEAARRFGWWPGRSTPQTVRAAYADWAASWRDDGPRRTFAVRRIDADVLVGGCELRLLADESAEVGYWTHAGERGQGYARESLALLLRYADSIGVTHVEANVASDNHASRKVAEAAGLIGSGTVVSDDGTEMIRYSLARSQA